MNGELSSENRSVLLNPIDEEIRTYHQRFNSTFSSNLDEAISRIRGNGAIQQAYEFAKRAHSGQVRKSGEPYIIHPIAVVTILNDWGITDEELLTAASLHDVVEDTSISLTTIQGIFGNTVASLVDGVSKFASDELRGENSYISSRKVLQTTFLDPRVAILKLADRTHNMLTLDFVPGEKQIPKAQETLDVYSRLAESLGIWRIKTLLEELSFRYLDPSAYQNIKAQVDNDPRSSQMFVDYLKTRLSRLLTEQELTGNITPRFNSCWTLRDKQELLASRGESDVNSLSRINDLVSFRVTLPNIKDCYAFLGIIHDEYGGLVDFDQLDEFMGANKRINGYSALQTTMNFPQGFVEIAIATKEMEEFNNWGIVSLINRGEKDLREYLLKIIFTPRGRIRFFPRGATGIDFAYSINPNLGASAKYVLVNGEQLPISTDLSHASMVEVIPGNFSKAPPPEYLGYCLPGTREVIEDQLRLQSRDLVIEKGKAVLEDDLAKRGLIDLDDVEDLVRPIIYRLGCSNLEDVYFKAGSWSHNIKSISEELDKAGITKDNLKLTSIRVSGLDQPGVLNSLTSWITKLGGNITNLSYKHSSDSFEIRLVVEKISLTGEGDLNALISEDGRFLEHTIV